MASKKRREMKVIKINRRKYEDLFNFIKKVKGGPGSKVQQEAQKHIQTLATPLKSN